MSKEAVKMVVWPKVKTSDGKTVYIVGAVVMTDRPIDWPNETFVMTSGAAELTNKIQELIDRGDNYKSPYQPGSMDSWLTSMGEFTPDECDKV